MYAKLTNHGFGILKICEMNSSSSLLVMIWQVLTADRYLFYVIMTMDESVEKLKSGRIDWKISPK